MIRTADELGYYACYSVDETWHKDLWVLFAAAADKTKRSASARTSRTCSCASRR